MDGAESTTILKRDALGRVTVCREQREALLDEFERSGLKGTQFARAAGIRYQTFAWWMQQRRHARGEYAARRKAGSKLPVPAALRLVEAVPAVLPRQKQNCAAPAQSAQGLEVLLPGGAKVLIADAAQAGLAAQLLKALGAPC